MTRLSGQRVADALLAYARKHNVTRIVIGKPTHSRLRDRMRGSLLDEVVRGSGDIDVVVISGHTSGDAPSRDRPAKANGAPKGHYVWAVALVALTLALAALLRR